MAEKYVVLNAGINEHTKKVSVYVKVKFKLAQDRCLWGIYVS